MLNRTINTTKVYHYYLLHDLNLIEFKEFSYFLVTLQSIVLILPCVTIKVNNKKSSSYAACSTCGLETAACP